MSGEPLRGSQSVRRWLFGSPTTRRHQSIRCDVLVVVSCATRVKRHEEGSRPEHPFATLRGEMRTLAEIIALATVLFQGSSAIGTSNDLRQRYGPPVSETFAVRPNVMASASYGVSGRICEMVISSKQSSSLTKHWPNNRTIDSKTLKDLEGELIPTSERGKFQTSRFVNATCLPANDCEGSSEEWENVVIYANAGRDGIRYETIQWRRAECGQTD